VCSFKHTQNATFSKKQKKQRGIVLQTKKKCFKQKNVVCFFVFLFAFLVASCFFEDATKINTHSEKKERISTNKKNENAEKKKEKQGQKKQCICLVFIARFFYSRCYTKGTRKNGASNKREKAWKNVTKNTCKKTAKITKTTNIFLILLFFLSTF